MIGQILKKKYDQWIASSETKDPTEFIMLMAQDHEATPELIDQILQLHEWFEKE